MRQADLAGDGSVDDDGGSVVEKGKRFLNGEIDALGVDVKELVVDRAEEIAFYSAFFTYLL